MHVFVSVCLQETFPTPLAVTEGLCFLCWELLNNFHTFYNLLERTHNKRNKSLKEIEPLEEYLLEEIEEKSEIGIPNEQDEDIFGEKVELEEIDVCSSSDNEDNHEKPDTGLPIDNVVEKRQQHNGTDNDSELDDSIAEAVKDDFPFPKSNGLRNPIEKHDIPHFIDDVPKRNKATYDSFLKEHFDITCDACFKPFETFALLVQHYSSEHKERGYVTCCETKFFFRHLLVDHIKYHLNPDYFKCTYCDNSFTTRRCLQVHIQLHEEKKYACSVCDKKFIKQSVLDNHKLKHFPPEKTIPCKDCGKL